MKFPLGLSGGRLALVTTAIFAVAGGIAYASIPDSGTGVYHACMAKDGKIRIIDPDTDQCKKNETEITFNQKGIQGAQGPAGTNGTNGAPGAPGTNGTNGVSPTVLPLAPGSICPAGGAVISDAVHLPVYVCSGQNGQNGADGAPFSGTFTSPNGQYSIAVTNTGVTVTGPGSSINVSGTGVRVDTHTGSVTVMSSDDLTLRSGNNATVDGGNTVTVKGGATATVEGGGTTTIKGGSVNINGGTCMPAARVGDPVDGTFAGMGSGSIHGTITTGSGSVCIG